MVLNVVLRNLPTSFVGKRELDYCERLVNLVPHAWVTGPATPDCLVPIEDYLVSSNMDKTQEATLAGRVVSLLVKIHSHMEARRVAKQWNISL